MTLVYPRRIAAVVPGLSPRVRGNRHLLGASPHGFGVYPRACGGTIEEPTGVYPRACGGTARSANTVCGSIPARAGEPLVIKSLNFLEYFTMSKSTERFRSSRFLFCK